MAEKQSQKSSRSALGKGLSALLADSDKFKKSSPEDLKKVEEALIAKEIPVDAIEANPFQPRTEFEEGPLEELSQSIKLHGLITPITVRKLSDQQYQLISGERRWQASKRAGLKVIPAFIRQAENDQQMLEWAIIENIQREDLNSLEIAQGYQRLINECGITQEELGSRVGKERSTVTNYLRLLKLPDEIQASLLSREITMGHARALTGIKEIDLQLSIYRKIIAESLSVRKTEELVKQATEKKSEKREAKRTKIDEQFEEAYQQQEKKLVEHFGTNVKINTNDGKKGEIRIPFVNVQDFNRILELLELD